MRRLLLFAVSLVLACSTYAMAQTWHWALSGGYNPTTILTSEGLQAWTANPVGGGAYWESVPSDTSTALRIVDTDPSYKVRWDDTYHNLFKDDVSSGMTVSFRIKLEDSALGSGSSTSYTVFRFSNHLLGAGVTTDGKPVRNKLQLNLKNYEDKGNCLYNTDYAYGLDGTTPVEFCVEDHQWHTFRSLHTVNQDGTIHYRIYWDGQLVQDYSRISTNTDAGKLGTDSASNIFTYQLDYMAVSLDGAWLEDQLNNPCELVIASAPVVNVSPDQTSATITWSTNEPAQTSMVHYGESPSCSETVTEQGGPKTSHLVTIPIQPFQYIYYYVESTSSTCLPAHTSTKTISTGVVQNPSFENGTNPWVPIPGYIFDGVHAADFGVWPHYGFYMAYSAASGVSGINKTGEKNYGGMYQIVSGLTPGKFYELTAWVWTRTESAPDQQPAGELNASCRVGIDPTAGTNVGGWSGTEWAENSDIIWSPWSASDNTLGAGGPWKQIGCAAKAIGTTATIYIQQQHMWPLLWNITAFDDVWLKQAPPPPPGIGAAKSVQDGYPAMLPDKIVTASWPGQGRFYIEEEDRSSAIMVTASEDTITLPAVGSKVTVSGSMASGQHGERVVAASEVTTNGTATVPAPIGMSNKAVGDKANTGLLVKVWGKVLENPIYPGTAEFMPGSSPDQPGYDPLSRFYVYIDDGSGVTGDYILAYDQTLGQWANYGQFKGIKVYYPADYYTAQPGEYIICTGIAGYELSDSNFITDGGSLSLVRTLEMRQTLPVDESSIPKHLSDVLVYPAGSY